MGLVACFWGLVLRGVLHASPCHALCFGMRWVWTLARCCAAVVESCRALLVVVPHSCALSGRALGLLYDGDTAASRCYTAFTTFRLACSSDLMRPIADQHGMHNQHMMHSICPWALLNSGTPCHTRRALQLPLPLYQASLESLHVSGTSPR